MRERPPRADGRPPFVWVEDDDTGHRYDIPQTAVRAGMTAVPGYPLNWSGKARAPKFRSQLFSTGVVEPNVDEPSGDAVAARVVSRKNKEAS